MSTQPATVIRTLDPAQIAPASTVRDREAPSSAEAHRAPRTRRIVVFIYGVVCYMAFFATFLYAMGFVIGVVTPTRLDAVASNGTTFAWVVNLGLLVVFALQHSVMARPAFKRWWTRFVPEPAERSTYVLFSSIALGLLFWWWQPMGGLVWDVQAPAARVSLLAVGLAGWALIFIATCLINHFDLFGLRQVWLYLRGRPYTHLVFQTPGLYRLVRHPLYVGWLLAFWGAPTMSVAHLVFAIVTTVYILVAIKIEERDLITYHGDEYRQYRKRVPMLVPVPRRSAR